MSDLIINNADGVAYQAGTSKMAAARDHSHGLTGAAAVHAATAKTTPVNADEVGITDSAASYVIKKVTWANIKATLKTYLDTIYTLALLGGVPTSTTVNGKALTGNISLAPGDIGISSSSAALSSPVTMTTVNTYYDGPPLTLGIGTWLVIASSTYNTGAVAGSIYQMTAKLWNGTAVGAATEQAITTGAGAASGGITLTALVTVASGTQTWKMSSACARAACVIDATCPDNGTGTGNTATSIIAVKIA